MRKFIIGIIVAILIFIVGGGLILNSGTATLSSEELTDLSNIKIHLENTPDYSVYAYYTDSLYKNFIMIDNVFNKHVFGCMEIKKEVSAINKREPDYYENEFNKITNDDYILTIKYTIGENVISQPIGKSNLGFYTYTEQRYEQECHKTNGVFVIGGECRFTRQEITEFGQYIKDYDKNYHVKICNKTHILIGDKENIAGTLYPITRD